VSNIGRPVNHAAREAKVEAIVDAAIQCFVKKGFHGAGMAEISRTAKVSQANLYQYFTSKNELILEIAKRYFSRDLEALKRVRDAADFKEALEVEARLTGDKVGTIMYLEVLAESSRNPEVKKVVVDSGKDLYETFYIIIEKAQQLGTIGDELTPEQVTHFVFAYIDGLSCQIAAADIEYSSHMLTLFIKTLLKPTS